MDQETIESFRRALLVRAMSSLCLHHHALREERQPPAEREPDWEDLAADETAAALLASLSETEQIAAERIQAAALASVATEGDQK